jgi:hypothetical protein
VLVRTRNVTLQRVDALAQHERQRHRPSTTPPLATVARRNAQSRPLSVVVGVVVDVARQLLRELRAQVRLPLLLRIHATLCHLPRQRGELVGRVPDGQRHRLALQRGGGGGGASPQSRRLLLVARRSNGAQLRRQPALRAH